MVTRSKFLKLDQRTKDIRITMAQVTQKIKMMIRVKIKTVNQGKHQGRLRPWHLLQLLLVASRFRVAVQEWRRLRGRSLFRDGLLRPLRPRVSRVRPLGLRGLQLFPLVQEVVRVRAENTPKSAGIINTENACAELNASIDT